MSRVVAPLHRSNICLVYNSIGHNINSMMIKLIDDNIDCNSGGNKDNNNNDDNNREI